jgi:hypothetical protein
MFGCLFVAIFLRRRIPIRSDRKSDSRAAPRKKIATLSNELDPGRSPFTTAVNFGAVEAKVFRTGRNPTYSYITTFPAEAPGAIMLVHSRSKPKLTSW